jgi:plasmid stabilization system protein ParE
VSYFLAPQAAEELAEIFNWTIERASLRVAAALRQRLHHQWPDPPHLARSSRIYARSRRPRTISA